MRPGFQRYPTARNLAEHLLESFGCGGQFLFQDYFARFIQNTVTAGAISQIQTDRQLVILENLDPFTATVLIFFIAGLLFAPRARRSLGAYRIPLETGLLIPSG
jgi:hypothetical protein